MEAGVDTGTDSVTSTLVQGAWAWKRRMREEHTWFAWLYFLLYWRLILMVVGFAFKTLLIFGINKGSSGTLTTKLGWSSLRFTTANKHKVFDRVPGAVNYLLNKLIYLWDWLTICAY